MIESIVITKHGSLGYVASLRFKDSSLDEDISNTNKKALYSAINFNLRKKGILQ